MPGCIGNPLVQFHPLLPSPTGRTMAMGQKPNRTPSEHPNPTTKSVPPVNIPIQPLKKVLKWVHGSKAKSYPVNIPVQPLKKTLKWVVNAAIPTKMGAHPFKTGFDHHSPMPRLGPSRGRWPRRHAPSGAHLGALLVAEDAEPLVPAPVQGHEHVGGRPEVTSPLWLAFFP